MNEGDRIVTFRSYYDLMLAQIIRTRLEANDIPCFISDYNMVEIIPKYNQAIGGVKINVFEKDLERCDKVLAIEDGGGEESQPEVEAEDKAVKACPYCESTDIRFGIETEVKFHLPSVVVSLFTGVPVYFKNAWHCFNCFRNFD